jgi:hypothetical protein
VASYEGSSSYAVLKVASVLTATGAIILAIAVWASANDPQLGFDAFGELTITEESDSAKIVGGIAILVVGLVQAALFWAVGTIGEHVIQVRSLLEPSQPARTVPTTTPRHPSADTYQLVIMNTGSRPEKVTRALRESFGVDESTARQALAGSTPLTGGYATVEGARLAVQAAGGRAETEGPLATS